jgi:hypothetical protein
MADIASRSSSADRKSNKSTVRKTIKISLGKTSEMNIQDYE